MTAAIADSLKSRTGRTLREWVTLVETASGLDPLDQKAVRGWLRDVHGVPQNSQWAIAFVAVAPGPRGTLRVGFRFRQEPPADARLSPARGFAQATHWLHLPADSEPDAAASGLLDLLRAAYGQNG